jgi:hypothetical protein
MIVPLLFVCFLFGVQSQGVAIPHFAANYSGVTKLGPNTISSLAGYIAWDMMADDNVRTYSEIHILTPSKTDIMSYSFANKTWITAYSISPAGCTKSGGAPVPSPCPDPTWTTGTWNNQPAAVSVVKCTQNMQTVVTSTYYPTTKDIIWAVVSEMPLGTSQMITTMQYSDQSTKANPDSRFDLPADCKQAAEGHVQHHLPATVRAALLHKL